MTDAPTPGWEGPPTSGNPSGLPYPASTPPPPPYGYTPYNPYGGGNNRQHPQGTTVLVLGILSLVICGFLGPVAWAMGQKAMREIDADPTTNYTNRGNVNAGRICGIIATCFLIVGVVIAVIAITVAVSSN